MDTVSKRLEKIRSHLKGAPKNVLTPEFTTSKDVNKVLEDHTIVSQEVKHALIERLPIVALESTVLSHGLPYPENLKLANALEDIVRSKGCVPCTIAILDGKIRMGLDQAELTRLALNTKEGNQDVIHKASRRDIGWIMAQNASGATTVAATSLLAARMGIHVFATGGIGGVHRDGHITMDVSADLQELSKCPILVVCAGAKSILDIPRTLEYLETMGVSVVGYKTEEFPAFFTSKSGQKAPLSVQSALECSKMLYYNMSLGIESGILIANPILKKDEADAIVVEEAIQTSLQEAEKQGITGRDITPFILKRVSQLTKGLSLKANIALLKNNAAVAADIAREFTELRNKSIPLQTNLKVTVLGGIAVDSHGRPIENPNTSIEGLSIPGEFVLCPGGVGRNVAEALAKLKLTTSLISALGQDNSYYYTSRPDFHGQFLVEECKAQGIQLYPVLSKQYRTATFTSLANPDGTFRGGVADMRVFEEILPNVLNHSQYTDLLASSRMVVIDANIPKEAIQFIVQYCATKHIPVFFEPTSKHKCNKIVDPSILPYITFIKPNLDEIQALAHAIDPKSNTQHPNECIETLLKAGVQNILLTMGSQGIKFGHYQGTKIAISDFDAPITKQIKNVNGAGDSFVAGFVFGYVQGYTTHDAIRLGLEAAKLTLESEYSVSPALSPNIVSSL